MYAYIHLRVNSRGTQDIKKAISQEIYHMLGVAIVQGTARVSISIILAVDYSALYSLLNLMHGRGENIENIVYVGNLIKKQPNQTNSLLSFLPCLIDLFSYLSAQNAVHHDNDEPLQ